MIELAKSYSPDEIETRWYSIWEDKGYFQPRGKPAEGGYCIMLPPPNITGTLHMGHAFQDTLMDILIRYHRMLGEATLWQPGTDHAGIATQIVVERQLERLGENRNSLGRTEFLKRVWSWKEESGSSITRQMRRLGASCDWSRERFTMDEGLSRAVTEVFVKLYEQGLVYRGKRLVNWDPVLGTAVSDLEVANEEESGHMWFIRYPYETGIGNIVVATTRPETMLGDVAVAVHPDDERYQHLIGKKLRLPLTDRCIPVIADSHVDPAFGTGCVKITPAHDFNDYQIGLRHSLAPITILTLDARINEIAPPAYRGLDRFEARKKIISDLESLGLLAEIRPHTLKVPRGERSGSVIEPMLTDQWFVAMQSLADPALNAVRKGDIRFVPENWTTVYNQWLENIQDWCISRQLWWGHRIPAWYDDEGHVYVARTEDEAHLKAGDKALHQDEDVLDTWFSSALWPFSTLGWPDQTPELELFLPTSVLVTGFDIIFFWVARMIMMSLHFTGKVPFKEVYVHGLVRDPHGQKMSKSKGNVLDPLDLIDGIELEPLVKKRTTQLMNPKMATAIERATRKDYPHGIPSFGTDALRFTFASLATHGRDIKFDMQRCEGYRNFCNKLWNATRFVLMNVQDLDPSSFLAGAKIQGVANRYIVSRLQKTEARVAQAFSEYRFDLAARSIYEYVWDEYCDWYLELVKVDLARGNPVLSQATRHTMVRVLETVLRLAHPIIPFITEELWQCIAPFAGCTGTSIMLARYPKTNPERIDEEAELQIETFKHIASEARGLRAAMGLAPGVRVPLYIIGPNPEIHRDYLIGLCRLKELRQVNEFPSNDAPIAIAGDYQLMLEVPINPEEEKERLSREIHRIQAEIRRAEGKLSNEKFMERAPAAVVAQEQERLSGFLDSLEKLNQQINRFGS
ncbi:MAG TPA: valine--tRNA ligase [Burkholderiales bacterium]|nr:valine--tRNA ligase [Burkholderiales bacterium]